MGNPTLTKNYNAEAAIAPYRICKFGSADGNAEQAAAAADASFGVSDELGAAIGERCDIHIAGMPDVEYGGVVTRGGQVTADADGKAVAAVANDRTSGVAMVSAVAGDIGPMLLAPGTV